MNNGHDRDSQYIRYVYSILIYYMSDYPALTSTSEGRQHTRRAIVWPARLVQRDGVAKICRTFDISKGGVGLFCDESVRQDEPISVALQIPDAQSELKYHIVAFRAELIFQILVGNEYRVGLRWVHPREVDDKLSNWLAPSSKS